VHWRAVVLALLVASAPGALAAQPDSLAIDVKARSFQPGELMLVMVTAPAGTSRVAVTAFDRRATAFRVDGTTWRALLGIDLEQRPGAYMVTAESTNENDAGILKDGKRVTVVTRTFRTRRLTVAPDYVNPPPAQLARINEEAARIREVQSQSAPQRLWTPPFVRPVPGQANSAFGTRSSYNGERRSPHAGADFLSPAGTPIHAPNAGRVVLARDLFFTGNTVIIDHGLGLFSMLAHLSRIDVTEGDSVAVDQIVGLVGATGRVTGAHLHWAVLTSGARVDPLSLLALLGK
jgi:murein DD-endopeptidase MepM/ murein hydrolase activator NlpD